jgi:anti-sigma-K factor RskA
MNHRHLSDDQLIGLLYGVGNMEDDEDHLAGCPECADRLRAMDQARLATVEAPQISGRALAAQRQQILERLEHPLSGSHAWRWAPAAAAAALLAVALFLSRPSSTPPPVPAAKAVVNTEADIDLFTDVYSMEQDVEPRAAAPIRALFQQASFEPAASAKEAKNQ